MANVDIGAPDTEDADAIADCWQALAESQRTYDSHILPEANRRSIADSVVRHIVSEQLLVARADDIVGFVMFTVESGSYEQDLQRGIVENLYVAPDWRDDGVGSALLEAAEEQLRERGVDAVALEVMADNESARQFYREAGYRPHRIEMEWPVESDTHSKGDE